MDIGFIGLGNMGAPMARRLIEAGHTLVIYDTRNDAVAPLVALGAKVASSAQDVADRVETVMASLPEPQVVAKSRSARAASAWQAHQAFRRSLHHRRAHGGDHRRRSRKARHRANRFPVSGGVAGAEKGTLAVMVSGPQADIDAVKDALAVFGKVFVVGDKAGMGQTMKLANNVLSATAMAATSEAVVMGVKAGLDPSVMVDVINHGTGRNTASTDKFPKAIIPRKFNLGFATALMLKDVRLCVAEARALSVPNEVMTAVLNAWETANTEIGGDKDFTTVIQPIEKRAGVTVGKPS